MAIADQWNIWYLNAGMSDSESKRLEEATFMQHLRYRLRAAAMRSTLAGTERARSGSTTSSIDCAETKTGDLLIFEADNTAVVHNMDSPELFPYKPAQMHKIFDAFAALLTQHAKSHAERAA